MLSLTRSEIIHHVDCSQTSPASTTQYRYMYMYLYRHTYMYMYIALAARGYNNEHTSLRRQIKVLFLHVSCEVHVLHIPPQVGQANFTMLPLCLYSSVCQCLPQS